jgi:hypothetical protein
MGKRIRNLERNCRDVFLRERPRRRRGPECGRILHFPSASIRGCMEQRQELREHSHHQSSPRLRSQNASAATNARIFSHMARLPSGGEVDGLPPSTQRDLLAHCDVLGGHRHHSETQLENNLAENPLQPSPEELALHCHPNAGQRSAIIYSLVISCQRHGKHPLALTCVVACLRWRRKTTARLSPGSSYRPEQNGECKHHMTAHSLAKTSPRGWKLTREVSPLGSFNRASVRDNASCWRGEFPVAPAEPRPSGCDGSEAGLPKPVCTPLRPLPSLGPTTRITAFT